MKHRGKLGLTVVAVVLLTLLLISSTDLVFAEKQNIVYSISVLVPDVSDECWINFKKGMDQASVEYNADLSFVTLYEQGEATQQQELAQREVENGAQALIIAPASSTKISAFLSGNGLGVPVVSLYSQSLALPSKANVTADWFRIGGSLSLAVQEDLRSLERGWPQAQIAAVSFPGLRDSVEETYRGLADGIAGNDLNLHREILTNEDDAAALLAREGIDSVVALEPAVFQLLTEELGKQEHSNVRLYGVGCTSRVIRELESGLIRAAAVYGDYDAGYLSVQSAVNLLSGGRGGNYNVRHALVRPGELYNKEYELLLFPIS